MRKVLILSVTAGNGHNSCAKNVMEKLLENDDVIVEKYDLLRDFGSKFNYFLIDDGLTLLMKYARWVFDASCKRFSKVPVYKKYRSFPRTPVKNTYSRVLKKIYEFKPDQIFCTNYLAGMVIADLKETYPIPCPTICSDLDFGCAPFWEMSGNCDYLTLPHKDLIPLFKEKGFTDKQIVVTGEQINDKFSHDIDKKSACEMLGIRSDLPTIFIMFGGGTWFGSYKLFKKVVRVIKDKYEVQIIVINGHDKKGFDKISKGSYPSNIHVVNVGFTDKINVYMACSDFAVSKMGGLSTSECMNYGLPILCTKKIPLHERVNYEFFKRFGVARNFGSYKELKKEILYLLDNPKELSKMQDSTKGLKSYGARKTCELIMSLEGWNEDKAAKDIDYSKVQRTVKKNLKRLDRESRRNHRLQK